MHRSRRSERFHMEHRGRRPGDAGRYDPQRRSLVMPSGDAQRAWFPEMLNQLEDFWTPDVSWDALIAFCARMTAFRSEIRKTKGIRSPMMYCRSCKERHPAKLPEISPRSALYALLKLGMVSEAEMKSLDRDWAGQVGGRNNLTPTENKKQLSRLLQLVAIPISRTRRNRACNCRKHETDRNKGLQPSGN